MMIEHFDTNCTTTTISNSEQLSYHEEMPLGAMIGTGISCAVLVCIFFTCCSKQWDLFITEKITGTDALHDRYLQHDDHSSDLSDIVDDWDSGSDDSSTENGRIRENGYWINAMIKELSIFKPSIETAPDILPPLDHDATSNSCAHSSNFHDQKAIIESPKKDVVVTDFDLGPEIDISSIRDEQHLDAALSKTIKKLLRVASETSDQSEVTPENSSDCSSLTFSQATSGTLSDEWLCHNNDVTLNQMNGDRRFMIPCHSDDQTIPCGNTKRNRTSTGFASDITMDTTDVEDSQCQDIESKFQSVGKENDPIESVPFTSDREKSLSSSPPSVSILVPTFEIGIDELHEFDSQSGNSSNSSLTISDEESQFGLLEGREEV